jgi:excisionase family DNA binding protein
MRVARLLFSAHEDQTMKLLTIPETAQRLRVTPARVYELCRLSLLPHVRLGRAVRVDEQQLVDFISRGGAALPGGWRREPAPLS